MKLPTGIILIVTLGLFSASITCLLKSLPFQSSFDPIIAFTAHDALSHGQKSFIAETEQVADLYRYTIKVREELGNLYLLISGCSLLSAIFLSFFAVYLYRLK